MLRLNILAPLFGLFILTSASSLPHGNSHHVQRRHELSKRADGEVQLFRRISNVRMSFYDVEESGQAGSCGQHHVNSDATVAMNAAQMNSDWCFKTIRISYRGVTRTATISDTCPGCPYGGLDLTMGFFTAFAPHASGTFYGDWEFADATPTPPKPTTTKKSTIWHPLSSTSTTTRRRSTTITSPSLSSTPTSSSSSGSATAATTTSIDYFDGAASGLAVPTGVINLDADANLQNLNQVYIQIGAIAMAADRV